MRKRMYQTMKQKMQQTMKQKVQQTMKQAMQLTMKKTIKQFIGGTLTLCLVGLSIPVIGVSANGSADISSKTLVNTSHTAGTTYYIDQDGGNDSNSGTSEQSPWSSLEKINGTTFKPGDQILFQSGDVWTGQLSPKGSGIEGKPIIIGKYGDSSSRPLIQGNNWCGDKGDDLENRIFNAAVFFYNQQYWEITSLEVTNRISGDNPDDHIKKYGVLIMGKDAGTLRHMYTKNLYVHDIVSNPIGQQAGIGRGGIIYSIRGNQIPTNWDDIVIENNKVGPNINHYGINLISTWGSSKFQHETGIPDSEYANTRVNSTNISIRNNYCKDIGNAAICPSAYSDVLIEYNISDGCNSGPNGNVPIWWEHGDNTIAQYNEVFGSGASESKEDSQAFDADVNAKLNYIQYNYTHDNPSGAYFECALGSRYTTYIRYNISQNDGYGTNSYGGGAVVTLGGYSSGEGNKMHVYNNDFYLSEGHNSYITNNWDGITVNPDNFKFTNNVIFSNANSKGWHKDFMGSVDYNAYGGSDENIIRTDDAHGVTVSTKDFINIGSGNLGLNSVQGYKLSENSALISAGTLISGNGGLDYWGNPVSSIKAPNIGADNLGADVPPEKPLAENIALGKPAFADGPNQYDPSNGVDGNEDTLWIQASAQLNKTWTVDLLKDYNIAKFELVFEKTESQGAWGYQIEAAKDGSSQYEIIYDASSNTDGSRVHQVTLDTVNQYRYIRVRITKFPGDDYWPAFAELKLYES